MCRVISFGVSHSNVNKFSSMMKNYNIHHTFDICVKEINTFLHKKAISML